MKFSLRQLICWVIIFSIITILLRRPILFICNISEYSDFKHYASALEDPYTPILWIFSINQIPSTINDIKTDEFRMLLLLTTIINLLASILVHISLLVIIVCIIICLIRWSNNQKIGFEIPPIGLISTITVAWLWMIFCVCINLIYGQ